MEPDQELKLLKDVESINTKVTTTETTVKQVLTEVGDLKKKDLWNVFVPLIGVLLGGLITFFANSCQKDKELKNEMYNKYEIRYSDFINEINQYKEYFSKYNDHKLSIKQSYFNYFYDKKIYYADKASAEEKEIENLRLEVYKLKSISMSKFTLLNISDTTIINDFSNLTAFDYGFDHVLDSLSNAGVKKIDPSLSGFFVDYFNSKERQLNSITINLTGKVKDYLIKNNKIEK